MDTNVSPLLNKPPPACAKRLCGICKAPGHDRRICPQRPATLVTDVVKVPAEQQNAIIASVPAPPVQQSTAQKAPRIKWEECLYVLFDVETTGLSRTGDNIIEIAAMVVGPDCVQVEDGTFQSFVKPTKQNLYIHHHPHRYYQ